MIHSVKYVLGLMIMTICHLSSSSAAANEASDWYLHLNVKGLQSSALSQQVAHDSKKGLQLLKIVFGEETFDKIELISAYGNMQKNGESKVILVQGNFNTSQNQIHERWQELGLESTKRFNQQDIYQSKIKNLLSNFHIEAKKSGLIDVDSSFSIEKLEKKKDLERLVYAAFTQEGNIVLSDNIAEIEAWLNDNERSPDNLHTGLFEVVVDIQEAMMHAGVNLDEQSQAFNFESISARQLSQISASYNESGGDSELQLGLSAETTETATKIKSIVQGLIALKSLTAKNIAITNLLSNIRFEQNAGELKVIMSGSVDAFRALLDNDG